MMNLCALRYLSNAIIFAPATTLILGRMLPSSFRLVLLKEHTTHTSWNLLAILSMSFLASVATESLSIVLRQGNMRLLYTFCFTLPLLQLVRNANASEPLWVSVVVLGLGAWLGIYVVSRAGNRSEVGDTLHREPAKLV